MPNIALFRFFGKTLKIQAQSRLSIAGIAPYLGLSNPNSYLAVMNRSNITWFVFLLLFTMILGWGCADDSSQSEQPPASGPALPGEEDAQPEPSAADQPLEGQALYHMESYYRALEAEQVDVQRFFAPEVEVFFGSTDVPRERIAQSLQGTFDRIEDRQITIDPSSVVAEATSEGYRVRFSGKSQHTQSESGELVNSQFQNEVHFDSDWKIVRYQDASSRTAPVSSDRGDNLMQTARLCLQAFKGGRVQLLSSLMHPEYGTFLLTKPGALPAIYHIFETAELTKYTPWLADGISQLPLSPQKESLPGFTCSDLFSKEGCFLAELSEPYQAVSDMMSAMNRVEVGRYETDQVDRSTQLEQYVSAQMIDTSWGAALYFGEIEGKWYLLVIDIATYDCSA